MDPCRSEVKGIEVPHCFFGAFRDFVIFSGGERAVDCRKSRRKRSVIVHCLSKKRVFCFCNGVVISAM